MIEQLKEIEKKVTERLNGIIDTSGLRELRVQTLGKKGSLTQLLRGMGGLSAEERPKVGQMVNEVRNKIEMLLDGAEKRLLNAEKSARIAEERIDVTWPGNKPSAGSVHPLTRVYNDLVDIFMGMGFSIKDGPEIELDKYSFEMLNIPKGHPARDMQDTFYVSDTVVLRPHTSPVQIRTMLSEPPPIYILSPGRVYRSDDVDATHSPVFHQMEGLAVDKGIDMRDLKGVLDTFAMKYYGDEVKTRLRPSYFPFTEPSAEMDVSCPECKGSGCRICKGTGWIEVMGCGMVHPQVLKNCGIDTDQYSGYAFGIGLDRLVNIRYNITDIRLLYENDVRFIKQFGGI